MSPSSQPSQRPRRSPIPVFAGVAVLLCATLFLLRAGGRGLIGDEGTYVAMAASLARDFDLAFTGPDRSWAEAHPGAPVALILERTGQGLAYSKPVLYPLLAAPFVGLCGDWGAALLNLLALLPALALALAFLARLGGRREARDTLLTFVATGIVVPYVAWRMTETLQVVLALAGLVLALSGVSAGAPRFAAAGAPATDWADRLLARPWADLLGGALLGLLISLREPNALVAAVPVLAALLARDLRRAARIGAAIALAYLAALALTWALTGAVNPYKAPRATFNAETGYPVGAHSAAARARFDQPDQLATSSLVLAPLFDGGRTAYATLYFLVGRHTGLAIFLPAALFFAALALRRPSPAGVAALAGFCGLALFYLVWMPANFFGGETFLGNRYILAAYPCLLIGLARLPSRRILLAIWVLAAAVGLSALASEWRFGALDPTSQAHANAGLFRLLPYESTASNLDGRRDRYWAGDFVRFVDPFATPETWSFTLQSGLPAAEIEIATRFPETPMHLIAVADAAPATLVISDWRGARRYPLTSFAPGQAGGGVVHTAAAPWRRHRFWWTPEEAYAVRLVRFSVEAPGLLATASASVRVRYLGRSAPPTTGFARESAAVVLPAEVPAGSQTDVELRVRNTGTWIWNSAAVIPVQIGVRIDPLESGKGSASQPRFALPRAVAPGESLETAVTIDWPTVPGRYRVRIDLVAEDLAWFADKVGAPLASGEVEVREP
ncbi:MAG: hypothetical protein ABI689_11935 [Thermoanaerobaculia bacterium]